MIKVAYNSFYRTYILHINQFIFNLILSLTSCREFRNYNLSLFVLGSWSRTSERIDQKWKGSTSSLPLNREAVSRTLTQKR